jgi:hypothetical protein
MVGCARTYSDAACRQGGLARRTIGPSQVRIDQAGPVFKLGQYSSEISSDEGQR